MPEPREGYLRVRTFKIHYVEWGHEGSRIVLLHSMGMDAHSMELLAEGLSPRHRILALTILGHGDSSVTREAISLQDHAELMRECYLKPGFAPCVLVGHSIGGRMGMVLASDHASEIRGLVLVDIAPPDPSPRPWSPQTPEIFGSKEDVLAYLKKRYPKFTPEYYENRLRYGFVEEPDGSLKAKPSGDVNMTSLSTDLWPYVEKIRVPTLLVIGAESTIVTPDKLARMRRSIPNLETVTIQGATHMVPQDKPAEFEKAVKTFLSKIEK